MKYLLLLFFVLSLITAGCVREVRSKKLMTGTFSQNTDKRPIRGNGLKLRVATERSFIAGQKAIITFILVNRGHEVVKIPEWFTHETDNLLVHCQIWLPNTDKPDEQSWIPLSFDFQQPVTHQTLELAPGAMVLISKELPFVEKLRISPNAERRYFVKGELTLKSLRLTSETVPIVIHSSMSRQ